jgi:hypothetical protein
MKKQPLLADLSFKKVQIHAELREYVVMLATNLLSSSLQQDMLHLVLTLTSPLLLLLMSQNLF